jgi:hypothetical protein
MHDSAGTVFRFLRCSCLCQSPLPLRFSAAGAGNDLRGALGHVLPEEWFRPRVDTGPSGLRDWPRPFVLRISAIPETVPAQTPFAFQVHLFDLPSRAPMEAALQRISQMGLGPDRTRYRHRLQWEEVAMPLKLPGGDQEEIEVEFVTPTELKGQEQEGPPSFDVLVARARDRVGALSEAYGGGAPPWDYAGLRERARQVEIARWSGRQLGTTRRSTRTWQRHSLAGFRGRVHYRGPVGEFLPLLRVAAHTGVGRHTVWGLGELRLTEPSRG